MRLAACVVTVAMAAGTLAPVALADTVDVRFLEVGRARTVNVSGSVFSGSVQAGELIHQFANGNGGAAALNGNIATFCTEMTQHVDDDWRTFTLTSVANAPSPGSGMGDLKANAIADVYAGAAGQQHSSDTWAAAFQMLVWEIVYDYNGTSSSLNLNAGNVRFSSGGSWFASGSTIFDTLAGVVGERGGLDGMPGLRAVVNNGAQDQLVMVPLPGAAGMGMGAFAMLGLATGRRRR